MAKIRQNNKSETGQYFDNWIWRQHTIFLPACHTPQHRCSVLTMHCICQNSHTKTHFV